MGTKFDRDKFIHSVIFFAENTNPKYYGKTKALKLLFFSDFTHLRRYGRTIIGDRYFKLEQGPIPTKSMNIIAAIYEKKNDITPDLGKDLARNMRKAFEVKGRTVGPYQQQRIIPKIQFDGSFFSDSEREVMREIARRFKNSTAKQVVGASHRDVVFKKTRLNDEINLLLAFEGDKKGQKYFKYWKQETDEMSRVLDFD